MQYEGRHFKRFARTGRLASLKAQPSLSEVFHENTKLSPMSAEAYGAELGRFLRSPLMKQLTKNPQKVYSLGERESLEAPVPSNELEATIALRRSGRQFSGEPVEREEISRLLHYAYGITDSSRGYRAVASGGALYPLELYVLALNVRGLGQCIYHYNVQDHCLDVVSNSFDSEEMARVISFRDVEIEKAGAVVVISTIFMRSTIKYKDRGYRLILFEAGETAQNLCLVATSLGLDVCLLGGFLDDELSTFLHFDGHREAPLIPLVLGRSPVHPAGARPRAEQDREW